MSAPDLLEKSDVQVWMESLGYYREDHFILGKVRVRFHKGGFEIPLEYAEELYSELRERRKIRHPDEIKSELAMWKKSCSELNTPLVFQCKSARIAELEWVLSPEKEEKDEKRI